jgi:hypothetical protein
MAHRRKTSNSTLRLIPLVQCLDTRHPNKQATDMERLQEALAMEHKAGSILGLGRRLESVDVWASRED